ncbi:secretion protein EspD [Mycobacterium hubeiense]|uniref:secretion protein EspD n=1 Tax=Mycobacterium hubeiense TaxID=1867256 RepID=UPI000C7F32BE|nr:secretion protein EspD [Mycobacterium sp. QGD 101]
MGDDISGRDPWEEDDDLADGDEGSVLDAFEIFMPADEFDDADDAILPPQYTLANPQRTVSVTVSLDGRVVGVELSQQVDSMTESQLAEEITVIARLAQQQARATQHALIALFMSELGNDSVMTRGFLEHEVSLPSPETANVELARVFAIRYSDDYR